MSKLILISAKMASIFCRRCNKKSKDNLLEMDKTCFSWQALISAYFQTTSATGRRQSVKRSAITLTVGYIKTICFHCTTVGGLPGFHKDALQTSLLTYFLELVQNFFALRLCKAGTRVFTCSSFCNHPSLTQTVKFF